MNIGKKYKIDSDNMNYTLLRRSVKGEDSKTPGAETWTPIGYYSNAENALKALVDMEVAETELKDLKTVIAKQDELYKLIEGVELDKEIE